MKPLKEKASITLDPDVLKDVKNLAEWDGRPLSQYINKLLRRHVEEMKRQHPEVFQ